MEHIYDIALKHVQNLKPSTDPVQRISKKQLNAAKQNRKKLKNLSDSLRTYQDEARKKGISIPTINELLIDYYCQQWKVNTMTLKTYEQWKSEGYQVIKGEKSITAVGQ